jgi:hypothetical protein
MGAEGDLESGDLRIGGPRRPGEGGCDPCRHEHCG